MILRAVSQRTRNACRLASKADVALAPLVADEVDAGSLDPVLGGVENESNDVAGEFVAAPVDELELKRLVCCRPSELPIPTLEDIQTPYHCVAPKEQKARCAPLRRLSYKVELTR